MCNLYRQRAARSEIVAIIDAMYDTRNADLKESVYPDYPAAVVVAGQDGREVRAMRWGMPSSKAALIEAAEKRADKLRAKGTEFDFAELLKMEPDKGTTNIRNTISKKTGRINTHWAPWLGRAHRCLVPFTSFSEPDQDQTGSKKPIWFALSEDEPIAFFAGIWTPHACVRMKSKGWEDVEAFGFLTTDSAEPVATYHGKAMPVILTEPAEWDAWLSGESWEDVAHLQRPLANRLVIVPGPPKAEASPQLS